MSDETTPEGQVKDEPKSAPPPQDSEYKARYNGLNAAHTKVVQENKTLNAELELLRAKNRELNQQAEEQIQSLNTQLDAAKLQTMDVQKIADSLQGKVDEQSGQLMKYGIIQELGDPSLIAIADMVPDNLSPEETKERLEKLVNWAGKKEEAREEELRAGDTPKTPNTTLDETDATEPTSTAEWQKAINAEQDEGARQQLMNDWFAWERSAKD